MQRKRKDRDASGGVLNLPSDGKLRKEKLVIELTDRTAMVPQKVVNAASLRCISLVVLGFNCDGITVMDQVKW